MKYILFIYIILLFPPYTVLAAGKGSIENRVERLERLMDSEKQLELLYRVNQLQQENQQLRGLLEEQKHLLQTIKNQQRNRYMDLNQRLNQVERGNSKHYTSTYKAAKTSTPPPILATERTTASVKENKGVEIVDKSIRVQIGEPETQTRIQRESITVESGVSGVQEKKSVYVAKPMSAKERQAEQRAYQKAYDQLRAQRYAKSRDSFSAFIKQYPHGRYAHIAQYWIGESSYAQKDYQQAIQDYQQLVDFYPNSPKRAESQLKIAYSFYEMGDKANARKTLKQLLAQYPDTTEASQAKRLLKYL
jgi:tol-pal system protein YbgF